MLAPHFCHTNEGECIGHAEVRAGMSLIMPFDQDVASIVLGEISWDYLKLEETFL